MMWLLLLLIYIAHPSEGEHRMILRDGSNPCEGHIEVYYDNKWGYVGDKDWSSATEEVACRSTHCGSPMPNSIDVERLMSRTVWLNELNCRGTEDHLWNCDSPGWDISKYRKPYVKKIKCSNKIKMGLDGHTCAGAVRFSIDNGTSWAGYLCADNWSKREADFLCESLNCGKSKELAMENWMIWKNFELKKKMIISCSDINPMDNLWQCVTKETRVCKTPASVVCNGYERLQLRGQASDVCSGRLEIEEEGKWTAVNNNRSSLDERCHQMHCGSKVSHTQDVNGTQLKCSDTVNVVLMDGNNPSKCYGAVHINVSGKTRPVCGFQWDLNDAQVVCNELNCGKVISHNNDYTIDSGIMDNVACLGSEASLWHCRAKRSPDNSSLKCLSKAYVVCADSIDVRLMDGPEKCAGRVEINYMGIWRQVDKNGWTEENSNTVCNQMNCGNKGKLSLDKFSKGSEDFLTNTVKCGSGASNISDCLANETKSISRERETVGIICKKHIMVFLKGNASSPCSGTVGIEHDGNTKWLSGLAWNQEAANTVCQHKKCGNVSSYSVSIPTADMQANIWNKFYNCSENSTSLFKCKTKTLPSDQNNTVVTVTCTGTVKFKMNNGCWGNVVANVNGQEGGVCGDTWTLKHSEMLCMSQGCGGKIVKANKQPAAQSVLIKSLHSTKHSTNLTQCNFVLNDDNTCRQNPAYIVCAGSVKPRFSMSVDKCSGNVEVLYEGTWLPVCGGALENEDARHTICQELGCGQALKQIPHFGPKPIVRHVISQLVCQGAKSLSECNITSVPQDKTCTLAGLECADSRKMMVGNICSGPVSIYSNEKHHAVSIQGWTNSAGEQLCRDLKCGQLKFSIPLNNPNTSKNEKPFWNKNFNCSAEKNPENIWDCENSDTSPSHKQQLYIECSGKHIVSLSGNCHGEVTINGMKVCNSHWDDTYSDLLCQEMHCSNAVRGKPKAISSQSGDVKHVRCDGNHYELSQCKTVEGKCDGQPVSVYCVGNVEFNTTEHCGGQILVSNGPLLEKICPPLNTATQERLCKKLKCGVPLDIQQRNKKTEKMNFALECTSRHMDIRHCLTGKECSNKPAEIYCDGYTFVNPITDPPSGPSVTLIVVLVLVFIMVILIAAFVRICIIRRARDNKNMRLRMMAGEEMDFESGDYEDVKENEMEDLNRGNFRSDSEITERDARSTSSLPYDDIDEVVEAQPLTSQADTTGASRNTSIQQDGVTYEVDDPQENYDDIDVSPEITQTTADVHDSPVPTPKNNTVAPPEVVQEDGDYVEPDQDG